MKCPEIPKECPRIPVSAFPENFLCARERSLWGRGSLSHFTDVETEAQREVERLTPGHSAVRQQSCPWAWQPRSGVCALTIGYTAPRSPCTRAFTLWENPAVFSFVLFVLLCQSRRADVSDYHSTSGKLLPPGFSSLEKEPRLDTSVSKRFLFSSDFLCHSSS